MIALARTTSIGDAQRSVPWERIEATLLAGALTARPQTDDARFPTLSPTEDVAVKLARARSLLDRLDQYRVQYLPLGTDDERERRLLDAIDLGDHDEMARLGLDAEYAWLDVVVAAMVSGAPYVEFETVGPYAAHHRDRETGRIEVSAERFPPDERAGLLVAALVRALVADCENARIVSLLDDVNDPVTGTEITENDRLRYVVDMGMIFYGRGVLLPEDVPGRDYVLLRESRAAERVDELIDRLRHSGVGTVDDEGSGDVTFRPARPFLERLALNSANRSREFLRRGIMVRRSGRATCQALEAAGFLDAHNRYVVHTLVLDASYAAQQDKTYTLLQALGIVRQDTHHSVFYDSTMLTPEAVARAVSRLIERELRLLVAVLEGVAATSRSAWPDGPERAPWLTGQGAAVAAATLADLFGERRVAAAVDVGTDLDLHSAQLVAPYVAEHGTLTLVHSSRTRCEHLVRQLDGAPEPNRLAEITEVRRASAFELADGAYDLVTSFVEPASATTHRREFRVTVNVLARALRPGGVIVMTCLVRTGPAATSAERAWAAPTVDDVLTACREAGLVPTLSVGDVSPTEGAGTVLVSARLRR